LSEENIKQIYFINNLINIRMQSITIIIITIISKQLITVGSFLNIHSNLTCGVFFVNLLLYFYHTIYITKLFRVFYIFKFQKKYIVFVCVNVTKFSGDLRTQT